MKTFIKSQAGNSWVVPSKELAGIILNFIEKVKTNSHYFDNYKGYTLQLTEDSNGKVLELIGEIVQPVVSHNPDTFGYDWFNHKRGILKVFNIDEKKFEPVGEVAAKPIPSWFNKMCEILADR